MAIRSVGQLGPGLEDFIPSDGVWFDANNTLASPQLGATETDTEGNTRVFVKASAQIAQVAQGTQITITRPAFTAAAGAGGAYSLKGVVVPNGAYFWARIPVTTT